MVTFGGATLAHDLNGNLTSDGSTTYTWDSRNRLSSLSATGMTASFQYDAVGRRLGKTVNGTTTAVLHNGLDAAQETTGTTVRNILTGAGLDEYLSHASSSGETRFALADALGSTIALVDASAAVVTEYTYEPFGATVATGAASENHAQYTGRENDGTGLYYYRARYYHPGLQRFISEDPFRGRDGGWNAYAHATNRPLNFTDPLGLFNLLVGANASAIGVTGVEGSVGGFVNYGGGTQQPDVGGFVYAGMGTGVDVGYGGFVGVVFGGTDAVAGVTANITVSVGFISVSSLYGANGWSGFTIGVGPTAVPFGGSATVGKTGTLTLSEALDMAFGKRPPAGGSPSSSGPPKSKSSR